MMHRSRTSALGGLLAIALGMVACDRAETAAPTPPAPVPPEAELTTPPPPPAGAFIALLSPEQTAEIRTLGVAIVVPTVIPPGFRVEAVETGDAGVVGGKTYTVLYRDLDNRCFLVEFTEGGIGGLPATEYRLPIKPPLFDRDDYGLNYGEFLDADLRSQADGPELMTDWLEGEDGFYRIAGASYINTTRSLPQPCQDVTPEEAVQLAESMAVLTQDISGDG